MKAASLRYALMVAWAAGIAFSIWGAYLIAAAGHPALALFASLGALSLLGWLLAEPACRFVAWVGDPEPLQRLNEIKAAWRGDI